MSKPGIHTHSCAQEQGISGSELCQKDKCTHKIFVLQKSSIANIKVNVTSICIDAEYEDHSIAVAHYWDWIQWYLPPTSTCSASLKLKCILICWNNWLKMIPDTCSQISILPHVLPFLSHTVVPAVRRVPVHKLWQEQELHPVHAGSAGGGIRQMAGQPSR